MLRRLSVRGKILAALAVPVIVLFVAAAIISAQAINDARVASQASALVNALAVQDDAGRAIAQERAAAMLASTGAEGADEMVAAAREATDREVLKRDRALRNLNTSALDPRVTEAIEVTLGDGDDLITLRRQIDGRANLELATTATYTGFITNALQVQSLLADTSDNREIAQYLDAYHSVNEMMEQLALERPLYGTLMAQARRGQQTPAGTLRGAIAVQRGTDINNEARTQIQALGLPGVSVPLPPPAYTTVRTNVGQQAPQAVQAPAMEAWDETASAYTDEVTLVRNQVRDATEERASALASSQTITAAITIGVTLLVVALSILVAGLIARGIVNPLRRLTSAAADVRYQLPKLVEQVAVPGQGPSIDIAPIAVESSDEVGQLASAFNDVNATTIQVAREQAALRGSIAEMFVNVARRDQVLLNRQLSFLDDLERSEEDPSTLSNLFRLDHLATRMRRNAESLLVLAGIDSGRRVRQPMPASDVIRTASSEIELYDRVRLNLVVDPLMLGHNALNAAHLVAEILENATMFSEPHTPVEVTTARTEEYVQIIVRDHGLGMTAEEIAEANRKVATNAASEIVGAQRLGLYVVGRLADRLGANVVFAPGSDGSGTEVTVNLPAALFVPDSNVPLPQPTDPLETSTQAAAHQITGPGAVVGPPTAASPVIGPPTAATPQARPVTAGTPITEPEPPVAVPVDLAALTDGTTQQGMPRRRSRGVDPASSAPSASFSQGPQTGAIVLPPLATPSLPSELPASDDEAAWTPPEDVTPSSGTLPSRSLPTRQRGGAEAATSSSAAFAAPEPEPAEVPVLDVSTRSALFSSFRSLSGLNTASEGSEHVELDAAPAVSAADISVPDGADGSVAVPTEAGPDDDGTWAPTFAIGEEPLTATRAASDESPEPAEAPSIHGSTRDEAYDPAAAASSAPVEDAPAWAPERPSGGYQDLVRGVPDLQETHPRTAGLPAAVDHAERAGSAPEPFDGSRDAVDETTVLRAPVAPGRQEPARQEPAAPYADVPDVPEVTGSTPAQGTGQVEPQAEQEEIPEELTFEALPRFEELMADLPTRRSLRESANRKRGLFGRKPRPMTAPVRAVSDAAAARAQALSSGVESSRPAPAGPSAPVTVPAAATGAPSAEPAPPAPTRTSAFAGRSEPVRATSGVAPAQTVDQPALAEQPLSREPQAPSQPQSPVRPGFEVPQQQPGYQPQQRFAPQPAYEPERSFEAPQRAPEQRAQEPYRPQQPYTPEPAYAPQAPAARPVEQARPVEAPRVDGSGDGQVSNGHVSNGHTPYGAAPAPVNGAPLPLARRESGAGIEPLDPGYITDSVEARSDWMASAVLYEEMSSLLRSTPELQEPNLADQNDTYRPVSFASEGGQGGLTRRARQGDRGDYVDRFTARIDRDPEQLRARLSAFQSATARGRVEGVDDQGSTGTPRTVDYVPDSAPQSR